MILVFLVLRILSELLSMLHLSSNSSLKIGEKKIIFKLLVTTKMAQKVFWNAFVVSEDEEIYVFLRAVYKRLFG